MQGDIDRLNKLALGEETDVSEVDSLFPLQDQGIFSPPLSRRQLEHMATQQAMRDAALEEVSSTGVCKQGPSTACHVQGESLCSGLALQPQLEQMAMQQAMQGLLER